MTDILKTIITLQFLFVIVFSISAEARELEEGMQLINARKLLISKGWRPIKTNPVYGGTEKILIDAHIIEVESCAMDLPGCIFNYKKGNVFLRLFTEGEEIKDQRISYWEYDRNEKDKQVQNKTLITNKSHVVEKDQIPNGSVVNAKENEMGMPILNTGISFLSVRNSLVDKGWKPINVHKGKNYKYDAIAKDIYNAQIIEVESCGIDRSGCIFNYKKGKVCLRLFTDGNNMKELRLDYFRFDCPDR